MKTTNESVRAWAWHVAIVTVAVLALTTALLLGVAAVLNWGPIPGIAVTLTTFALGAGTISWLVHGKERP